MKLSKKLFLTSALLGGIALSAVPAFAADGGVYSSNGAVSFKANTDPTNPVDPLDPTNPVKPTDPTNPDGPNPGTAGPLSIDFASSFQFGEQKITSTTETYKAQTQKYTTSDNKATEGPNYVQVSDNRGTETGWTLNVKQGNQFKTDKNQELTGAKLTLANGTIITNSASPKPTGKSTIVLDPAGAESLVMSAAAGQGAGTYLTDWGDAKTAADSVTLEVPGSTTKYANKYTTTLTWTLSDTPGNPDTEPAA